jgi:hypothetical protein
MSVRVYSPDAGIPVRLKIEDKTAPTKSVETEAMTTVANAWETLVFDFANQADGTAALNPDYTFDLASIFFNFGTTGADAGEKIYYWDDVMFVAEVDDTPRSTGEDAGSNTITMTVDPGADVIPGNLIFLDDGTELGKILSVAGRVITLEAPLAAAIPAESALTFVVDNTPDTTGGKLVNISTRGAVGTGDNVLIGGFVIGTDTQQVYISATGPELANSDITGFLVDPVLTITNITTGEETVNDNWEDTQGQLITDLWGGAPPLAAGSLSAGIVMTLNTGSYTAKISGAGDTTGTAIIEVFEID